MLLVLLLGVADFGRVFAAGITLEAATRDAAEIAAQAYLQQLPPDPSDPEFATFDFENYYQNLHDKAAVAACNEAQVLPNTNYVSGTCPGMPLIAVCVHDDDPADANDASDSSCGEMPFAGRALASSLPNSPCPAMNGDGLNSDGAPMSIDLPWTAQEVGSSDPVGTEVSRYIEVRMCYRFTTLFNLTGFDLPFGWNINVGNIYLYRRAVFTIADY